MVTNKMTEKSVCKVLEFGREIKVDADHWNAEELTRFAKAAEDGNTVLNVINYQSLSESSLLSILNNREEYVMFL